MLAQYDDCSECGKHTMHFNGKCGDCDTKKRDRTKRQHFGALDALTIEERLRRIEKQLYDLNTNPPWIEPTY